MKWNPLVNFFLICLVLVLILGSWDLIELGACKARDLGTWWSCSQSILLGVDYIF